MNVILLKPEDEMVNIYIRCFNYKHPIPSAERNNALVEILPYLQDTKILSRGRFRSWKYKVGSQG